MLNLIAEQAPKDYQARLEQVLQKMQMLRVKPDEKTYNYLIKAAGKAKDIANA